MSEIGVLVNDFDYTIFKFQAMNNWMFIFSFDVINSSSFEEEYLSLFIYLYFAIFLACIIVLLSYFLVTQNPETEKLSTYECGFEPYGDTRNQFYIRFFILAILFIVFDIEIIIMLPWCVSIAQLNLLAYWAMLEFLLELGIGFIYVWSVGALEWS